MLDDKTKAVLASTVFKAVPPRIYGSVTIHIQSGTAGQVKFEERWFSSIPTVEHRAGWEPKENSTHLVLTKAAKS
jgi:hypothetical protein